jgi:hypothetical protein
MIMAGSPKDYGEKIASILKAWKELRPAKTFAKMTLAQFTAAVQPSLDARATLDSLDEQTIAATVQRETADKASMEKVELVVNAVKGDPDEGEDGELYAGMGYVRKSARSTGKTNKTKKTDNGTTKP